jgi:hypothetical protein
MRGHELVEPTDNRKLKVLKYGIKNSYLFLYCKTGIITILSNRTTMRVFTKIDGLLACWQIDGLEYAEAIKAVRDELGVGHKSAILALVKY